MYFRGWVLDAHDQSPVDQQLANSLQAKLQIFSPADAEVRTTPATHCCAFSPTHLTSCVLCTYTGLFDGAAGSGLWRGCRLVDHS